MIRLMARLGTALLLLVVVFSCATVPGLREETPATFIRLPFVRVLLDESFDTLSVSGESQFAIECLTGDQQQVFYNSQPVRLVNRGERLEVRNERGQVVASGLSEVNLIPRTKGRLLHWNDRRYRGLFKALPYGQNVRLINIVYMEDYLFGVVPPEIGERTDKEVEAVKAQAIAARTYAMSHLDQYSDQPYDVKSTVIDQVYEGAAAEKELVNRAVVETAGKVIRYHGDFIQAYYHSTCGGSTDDIAAIWDRQQIPYLQPVLDSGACSWSKYYTWQERFTEPQLRGRIEQYLSSDRGRDIRIGRITDVKVAERTPGGRVARIIVNTEDDSYKFFKDRIRWVIGRAGNADLILASDRFDVALERDAEGYLTAITFKGRGYGHGVGMCQCGAIGLAREGWACDSIIKHYFAGVDIEKMY